MLKKWKKTLTAILVATVLLTATAPAAHGWWPVGWRDWQRVSVTRSGRRVYGDWRTASWVLEVSSETIAITAQSVPTMGRASVRNSRGTVTSSPWRGPGFSALANMERNGNMEAFFDLSPL